MSARRLGVPAFALAFAAAQPAHAEDAAPSCAPQDLGALAEWNGIWAAEGMDAVDFGISGQFGGTADNKLLGQDAPWNPAGWARMRAMMRSDRSTKAGWGYPMMMNSFAELKFIVALTETTIVNPYREIRHVYTDGRDHASEEDRWPTNWGDSVGCWDGDTLTIETVSVRYDPGFNAAAPPLSDQAHFVERLRLVAPGQIESEMTITDPVTLAAPWTIRIIYISTGIDRLVHDAFDDRIDTAGRTIVPSAQQEFTSLSLPPEAELGPAELDRVVGRYKGDEGPAELVVERREQRLFFQVLPFLTVFRPLFAEGPLGFEAIDGVRFRFVADEAGEVTGFEGTRPDGVPISGKRIAP